MKPFVLLADLSASEPSSLLFWQGPMFLMGLVRGLTVSIIFSPVTVGGKVEPGQFLRVMLMQRCVRWSQHEVSNF